MHNEIFEETQRLKRLYASSDPREIIEALGINLWMRRDLSGLKGLYCLCMRQRYIVVNAELSKREILLVAAHELGHDRLHREIARLAPLKDFRLYDMTSRTEHQANVFAAELLIEDGEVEACIEDEMDFFELCRAVGYCPQLVTFKLYGMMQRGHSINLPQAPDSAFLRK